MRLRIDGNMMVQQLQDVFSQTFPFLKIEIFKKMANAPLRHNAQTKIAPERFFKEILHFKESELDIEWEDDMTVQELESQFENNNGITAQVFRKSGNLWLETTVTDQWSLKRQNDHGQEISMPMKK